MNETGAKKLKGVATPSLDESREPMGCSTVGRPGDDSLQEVSIPQRRPKPTVSSEEDTDARLLDR